MRLIKQILALVVSTVFITGNAEAHTAVTLSGGLWNGFAHPFTGLDHMVAMVAVGLWGYLLGNPSKWVLPVFFPLVMALGGVIGVLGIPLPHVEAAVAISDIVLGVLVSTATRLPPALACLIVGIFAVFHGHAHGTEIPGAADPVSYALGFVLATGGLHLSGIFFGTLSNGGIGQSWLRIVGVIIAITGIIFLVG